jgi:DNA mismatch repair protein MutL
LTLNPNYNPYHSKSEKKAMPSDSWQQFLSGLKNETIKSNFVEPEKLVFENENKKEEVIIDETQLKCISFSNAYLVFLWNEALHFVDVKAARERILFEYFLNALENTPVVIQQSMFPETITLSASASEIVSDILPELRALGYDLEQMNRTSFVANGLPVDEENGDIQQTIEQLVEMYKSLQFLQKTDKNSSIAKSLARQKCSYQLHITSEAEQQAFFKQWLQCKVQHLSPSEKKVVKSFTVEEVQKFFA